MKHKILGYIFLVVVAAVIVGGIYYWQTTRQIPSQISLPTHQDQTASWKTYTNTTIRYSLKYPESYITTVSDPNYVYMKEGSNSKVDVRYRAGDNSTTNISWFDSEPVGDVTLGGIAGKKFVFKYCDGPGCGPDTVAYVVRYNGKFLGLEFIGDKTMDSTENQILSTFKFTE